MRRAEGSGGEGGEVRGGKRSRKVSIIKEEEAGMSVEKYHFQCIEKVLLSSVLRHLSVTIGLPLHTIHHSKKQ